MKFQILYELDWTPFWRSNEPASNVQEEKIKLIYRLSASTMSAVCTSPWRRAWRGRAVVTRDLNIWHFRTCLGLSAFELDDTWPGLRKKSSAQTCGRHIKVAKIMINGLGHFVQVRSILIFRAHMRHEQILLNYLIQLLAACISSRLATLRCIIFLDAISGTIKSVHILQSPIVRRRFSGPGKSEKGWIDNSIAVDHYMIKERLVIYESLVHNFWTLGSY